MRVGEVGNGAVSCCCTKCWRAGCAPAALAAACSSTVVNTNCFTIKAPAMPYLKRSWLGVAPLQGKAGLCELSLLLQGLCVLHKWF